jgi:hypothetical protein
MAFNFRPTNSAEIIKKNKKYSNIAATIFTELQNKWNVGVILDPTTNFAKLKIPREISSEAPISVIKQHLKSKSIMLPPGFAISFGNGSGAGSSNKIDAKTTAMQENATRAFTELWVEKNKELDPKTLKKIFPDYDEDWYLTFKLQAQAIKKYLKKSSGYEYSRDKGIMPYIEDFAKHKCGVRIKDNWNPADIYVAHKQAIPKFKKEVKNLGELPMEDDARLEAYNDIMRKYFKTTEIVGISLKKLNPKKGVHIEVTNLDKTKPNDKIDLIRNSINLNMDIEGEVFETGELSFAVMVNDQAVAVQIRAFSGGERESTQMDMTAKGAAAKLGKVSAPLAIDPFLRKYNLKRLSGSKLPKPGLWNENDINIWVKNYNFIVNKKIGGEKIHFGDQIIYKKYEGILREAVVLEQNNPRTASQLSSKLQGLHWLKILWTIDQKGELDDFLKVLYYGAKKQYDSAGVFLKVS